jgi:hypothetical protein
MGERDGEAVHRPVVDTVAFEQRVQRRAEAHLDACFAAEDEPTEVDSPAFGPFCGCMTCIVREVLMVCWGDMLEEAKLEAAVERTDDAVQCVPSGNVVRLEPRPGHD